MSIETWGDMNKSQVDNTLIETRISEMIAEHEADPTSHMGEGESISQHRENDVIDHPAGSVLTDKATTKEVVASHAFVPITNYSVVGVGTYEFHQENIIGGSLYIEGSTSSLYVGTLLPFAVNYPPTSKDCLFQFNAQRTDGDVFTGYFGLFAKPSSTITAGFGFKFIDDECYPFFVTSAGIVIGDYIAVDTSLIHQYRMLYTASTKTVDFYIDGELAQSISDAGTVPNSDSTRPAFLASANGDDTYISFSLFDWFFSMTI